MAKTEKRKTLTNEELAKAALELVDLEGVDALSFRKLSEKTGIPTMTIMNRFGSKYTLMKAALSIMLDEVDVGSVRGETWQESLRRVAHLNRSMALHHPKAFMLFVLVPIFESPVREFTAKVFETHSEQDLPEGMPAVFLSMMHSFLPGFQLAESYANEQKLHVEPSSTRESSQVLDLFTEDTFNRNIEIIISGLQIEFDLPAETA